MNTTTTIPPSGHIHHHLVTINIRTSLPYTPTLLTDPDFVRLLSATRSTLTRLSASATEAGEVKTLLILGPVLDGSHTATGGGTWIRIKAEVLVSSTHSTPDAVKAYLTRLLGTALHWDKNATYPQSCLPVTGHAIHVRGIDSLHGDAARDAMNRVAATENALYALVSSGSPLARTLPAKREVGLADMILMPMAQGGRR